MDTLRSFSISSSQSGRFHSLPALQALGFEAVSRLPISIRIILESLMRHLDGKNITQKDVENLANWSAACPGNYEIPFTVARVVLQDFTGVPLVVDLAAMRDAAASVGASPSIVEPLVPVDLVIDHSVQVDFSGSDTALSRNLSMEFLRNKERYSFLKWGQQAFQTFGVVPPGTGIVHQVNLEHLAQGVLEKNGVYYFDSLVGTDSHTTMINGLGVVGWGVGGIEAEAAMLGQPVTFLVPEVVGVHLHGELGLGVSATDLTLRVTEMLRQEGVVGKFVEFYGEGAQSLSLPDRATIANMAPEYGATMGFFPVDAESIAYLRGTGRSPSQCRLVEAYCRAQGLFGIPQPGDIDYSVELELDMGSVRPAVAGPKRPQDRIEVSELKTRFNTLFTAPTSQGGFERAPKEREKTSPIVLKTPAGYSQVGADMLGKKAPITPSVEQRLGQGSVVIAAITSCTNTSNPSVMLAAGLLAKKANALGLSVPAYVKTSLGPGSRVVTHYFEKTGLNHALDQLGFQTVGYGCTTCIGNSGPLNPSVEQAIKEGDLVCASVLSGNRNFEARVHGSVRANFLMSPPLVVAYALAGRVDINLMEEPLGLSKEGKEVFLADIWPEASEIEAILGEALVPEVYASLYNNLEKANTHWVDIPAPQGESYVWDEQSTYIANPPFFEGFSRTARTSLEDIVDARPLGIFGDSVTTDHISPAGAIVPTSPAGQYLLSHGVEPASFNSFGSRRGNDRVMTRGTFGNVRIKNLLTRGVEGGYTQYFGARTIPSPDVAIEPLDGGKPAFIYDAATAYCADQTPLIVIAGEDYGMGSSRDWAAKGTRLLGVQAVIAKSFERIHRSNLVGMGVLPLTFKKKEDYDKLTSLGNAFYTIEGLKGTLQVKQEALLKVRSAQGTWAIPLTVRVDTPAEIDYYMHGGILPYVLNRILEEKGNF